MCVWEHRGKSGHSLYRGIKKGLYMCALCAGMFFTGTTAAATEPVTNSTEAEVTTPEPVTNSTETEVTAPEPENTGKLTTHNGKKYYEYADGKRAKNRFVDIKGKTYYFGAKGAMVKGWMEKKGSYYYFDRSTGVQKKGGKVDGIKLSKSGKAQKSKYNKKKIATMITARKNVDKITKTTDTKEQKLKKVFDWVMKHPYKRHRIFAQIKTQKGWEMDYANDIFELGNGCCFSESCALAFMARECGYKKVYICDDTGHAWVEIDGYVYDTLFAEVKGYNKYYKSTYKKANLHLIEKKKL